MGAADKDKIIRFGVIGGAVLAVVIYGYLQLRTPDVPPPMAAPVVTSAPAANAKPRTTSISGPTVPTSAVPKAADAAKVGTTASQYDPSLKMEAMLVTESLVYTGSGRNIFSANSAPLLAAIPQPVAPVRPAGPMAPVAPQTYVAPPPAPIDLKFFGTETLANGTRQAFLLHGDDVFLAAPGSIVQRRYKIGVIAANSVEVEDMTNNNKQSLPLQKN
jgi:hypothetical protein